MACRFPPNPRPRLRRGFFTPPTRRLVLNFPAGKGQSMPLSVEPPVCGSCRITMLWFNSVRTPNTTNQLAHSFRCPSCNGTRDVIVSHSANVPVADDPAHWQKRADEIRQLAEKCPTRKSARRFSNSPPIMTSWRTVPRTVHKNRNLIRHGRLILGRKIGPSTDEQIAKRPLGQKRRRDGRNSA